MLGRRLLGLDLGGVRRVAAAVPADRAAAQVADPVHPLEQLAVVADDEQRAGPALDDVVEPVAGVGVEVVGGLVEQEHVGASQQQARQAELGDLAAGHLAEPAVEQVVGQPEPAELGDGTALGVPVVADRVEEVLVDGAALDSPHRPAYVADAEEVGDRLVDVEGQVLRQVADLAGDGQVAGGRESGRRRPAGAGWTCRRR